MDAFKSLVGPLLSSGAVDGMKLVVLGGTVETARRFSSSAWSHFVNSFFLTAHFSDEDDPYDWLMLWLSRRPEWQRSREFETVTYARSAVRGPGGNANEDEWGEDDEPSTDVSGKSKTRVVFQPTFDTTHTIYYRGHWLRVRRQRRHDTMGYGASGEMLSVSVVARSNTILKSLVLQAKKEYEAESVHRIQLYFADPHALWRHTDSRHKRPMNSIVLDPGVKEMLLADAKDFLRSEKWYADRGIPFRRGYLLHGVPGSGKSSLIHAIAGELGLDIYVVSLSSSWISDSVLVSLMGRVPKGCILLLEDLDAAFTRSVNRQENSDGNSGNNNNNNNGQGQQEGPEPAPANNGASGSSRRRYGRRGHTDDHLSELNTLSLSGLLNALDGVAAAEGRILFATTNHLEKLDPALSRPGRMDVWVEFKNASRWQAEALFRNFFPCSSPDPLIDPEDDDEFDERELDGIHIPMTSSSSYDNTGSPTSSLWTSSPLTSSKGKGKAPPRSPTASTPPPQFGASNQAYLPPPVAPEILAATLGPNGLRKPLDGKTLAMLAKNYADAIPEGEFSVAALQGYLLKNKSNPEAAANDAAAWVVSEREMRERLKREKEAKDGKERDEREKRRKEALGKEEAKKELERKELEVARVKEAEKEKARKEKEEKEIQEASATTGQAETPAQPTTVTAAVTSTTETADVTAAEPSTTAEASVTPVPANTTPITPETQSAEAGVAEPVTGTTAPPPDDSDSESESSEDEGNFLPPPPWVTGTFDSSWNDTSFSGWATVPAPRGRGRGRGRGLVSRGRGHAGH